MEVHMVANMEVDKVVKMVADEKEENKGAYKKGEEKRVPNLVRVLVTGVGYLGRNFFDPKLTRPACLLSFVSLFGAKENFALIIKPSRFLSRNFLLNITGWAQMIHLYHISTFVALVRFDRISLYPQKVAEERKPPRCVSLHVRTTKEEDGC